MDQPVVSVIMPVFNTGAYLREAVQSVLLQRPLETPLPTWELIVIDDHSSCPATLAILSEIVDYPHVRVLRNRRGKGAAGARNSGIEAARGAWIAFLDADDIWFPQALALRWQVQAEHPDADWIGGRIRLLRPAGAPAGFAPLTQLLAQAGGAAVAPARRMARPVAALAEECLVIPTTALIRRTLIVVKGMFDGRLQRAEDYHLWLRCALDTDLWMLPTEIAYYRIHGASLTHGDAPRFLHEDAMLDMLLRAPGWRAHRALLIGRMDLVLQDHCYFYRGRQRYGSAVRCALQWLARRPFKVAAWKELLASGMRIG